MLTLLRLAYLLIATCIVLAIRFSFLPLPNWVLLMGLFGGRLYLLLLDPIVAQDRRKRIGMILFWALMHIVVGVTDSRFQASIALPLLTLPLIYWLMTRFSTITDTWSKSSRRVTAVLVVIAGAGWYSGDFFWLSCITPICILITAAHIYHAFANHNSNRTLAAHWVALAMILWIGAELFDSMFFSIGATSDVAIQGMMENWLPFATFSVILGMGNQITADLRGEDRRITGLSAYWLVTFGTIFSGVLALCQTLIQIVLHQLDAASYQVAGLVDSLGFLVCEWQSFIPLGLLIYLAQFVKRRPPGLLSSGSEPRRPH